MNTYLYCIGCGKEFAPGESVVAIGMATVEPMVFGGEFFVQADNGSEYVESLCKGCYDKRFQPNRVVVEVRSGMVQAVRAERPDEIVVIIYATTDTLGYPYQPKTFGGLNGLPIGKLNIVVG